MGPAPRYKLFFAPIFVCLIVGGTTACSAPSADDEATATRFDRQAYAEESLRFRTQQAECLTEMGYPASIQPEDGGMRPMKVEHHGQPEQMHEAMDLCAEHLGGKPSPAPRPDAEEISKLYDLEIEAYECLVAHGYDPVPPPTPQTYVDTYLAEGPWSAHRIPGAVLPDSECPVPHWTDIEW